MCFSAAASFAGGAIISSIGIPTIRRNTDPGQRLFAAIPMIFGIQQICEGFVWIALQSPGHDLILKLSTTIFLITAVVVWRPLFRSPCCSWSRIPDGGVLHILFLFVGIVLSAGHAIGLMVYTVTVQISGYHILYSMDSPSLLARLAVIGYILATIPPLFLSSKKRVNLFGLVIVVAYAVTQYFYREYMLSVWCFFAALASLIIWWAINEPVRIVAPKAPEQP